LLGRVNLDPQTANGLSFGYTLDLDETPQSIKGSAGTLHQLRITNRTASERYVRLYNIASGSVTVGTSTIALTLVVPANADDYTVTIENFGPYGIGFSTAISIAATTSFADNDMGAPGTNDLVVSWLYK
jgi:hypothetical protein